MTAIFHRAPKQTLPVAVAGDGIEIIDATGKRYIDASGGAAVSCLGHSHSRIVEAIERQARSLAYAHTSFFTTEPAEALAQHLVERAPAGLAYVYFVSGGSEAMEAALKLARQYFVEIGQPERRHIVARRQSYHGNTLGALAIGGNARRRAPFEPLLIEAHHVSPCYAYRERLDGETDEAYVQRLADELEQTIVALGPDTVAAFVAETVVGATLGAVPPVADYFRKIRAVCDRYGVLLVLDEVMCGMGRTGHLYACEEDAIAPDLLTVAKGLGAGYQPIGAVLVNERLYDAIVRGSGFFQHGHTYIGHATACAAALEVQRVIVEENLLANVRERGAQLRALLHERFAGHVHIGDIRGRGLFVGVELVEDVGRKTPFAPERALHVAIKREAMARGLMVYPMGGTVDGWHGDHVLLAPPYTCTREDIERIVERLGDAIEAALASLRVTTS